MAREHLQHLPTSALWYAATLLLVLGIQVIAEGLPPDLSSKGRSLEQFALFVPPVSSLQQFPGPGDIGHNSVAAQPQCRAFWDQDAGVSCFVNVLWLASTSYPTSSLYGRALLYIAARQVQCNQHTDINSCLADRTNLCSPVTSPLIGFNCVVGADWTFAFQGLFNLGGAFGCPGSYYERSVRCRSMHKLTWYNANLTQADAAALCAAHGCVYEPTQDDCWVDEPVPPSQRDAAGDCPNGRYWTQQLQRAVASRSYTTCPYQMGYYDAINRRCTLNVEAARAGESDDLVTVAAQVQQGNCLRQALCAAKCEDFGNFTVSDDSALSAVVDVETLALFRELDVSGLSEAAAWSVHPSLPTVLASVTALALWMLA